MRTPIETLKEAADSARSEAEARARALAQAEEHAAAERRARAEEAARLRQAGDVAKVARKAHERAVKASALHEERARAAFHALAAEVTALRLLENEDRVAMLYVQNAGEARPEGVLSLFDPETLPVVNGLRERFGTPEGDAVFYEFTLPVLRLAPRPLAESGGPADER